MALAARPDLMLHRSAIPEPGRYYDSLRTIVLRTGLLIAEERRHLWHELVHADRRDEACHGSPAVERSVEREAAARAMPVESLEWAVANAASLDEAAGLLKVPEEWVAFRFRTLHPAHRAHLQRISLTTRLSA